MSSENKQKVLTLSKALNEFSVVFYKNLCEKESLKNAICSPLNCAMVLSMASYGARGHTQREMLEALVLSQDFKILDGFQILADISNNADSQCKLKLASKIFISQQRLMNPDYRKAINKNFQTTVKTLDFSNGQAACAEINNWCAEKTDNIITEIISPRSLTPKHAMILISAIYFKAKWCRSFGTYNTKPEIFYENEKKRYLVSTMHNRDFYNYHELKKLDATTVELKYNYEKSENQMSMFIIVPNALNGLPLIQNNLKHVDFHELIMTKNNIAEVNVSLPKFKFEGIYESDVLKDVVTKMGMKDMFEDSADFSHMILNENNPPMKVDKIVHKAYIEVNEAGTEAAALVFARLYGGGAPPEPPIEFSANRPFAFVIYHHHTRSILFQGHVASLPSCDDTN